MPRKTLNVDQLLKDVNESLAISTCSSETRQGMINVLENVLHATGNYRGFGYLDQTKVPTGELPGINTDANNEILDYANRFANTDKTRVFYF